MNPFNRPRIVNANIWDKHMADAFSLTAPMKKDSEFNLMNSRLNPESVITVYASDGYSNFSAGAVTNCNLRYPPPRLTKKRKDQYQSCLPEEEKKIDDKKAAGGGGILGIGTGRRKECKEAGLTGAEKRQCAKELKARGWKKGQPLPPDMAGITTADAESESEDISATEIGHIGVNPSEIKNNIGKKDSVGDKESSNGNLTETQKNILIYGGIALGAVLVISLTILAVKTPKSIYADVKK